MKVYMLKYFLIPGLALTLMGAPLQTAAAETPLGVFGDWEAYTDKDNGKLVCYMAAVPKKAVGKYKRRGKTYLLIAHRPAERSTNVVSFRAGYGFKKGAKVKFIIGKKTVQLFTEDGWAYTPDAAQDNALVKMMIRGAKLTVKGTSSRGTKTTDTYSLKGFTAAYKAIGKACKV